MKMIRKLALFASCAIHVHGAQSPSDSNDGIELKDLDPETWRKAFRDSIGGNPYERGITPEFQVFYDANYFGPTDIKDPKAGILFTPIGQVDVFKPGFIRDGNANAAAQQALRRECRPSTLELCGLIGDYPKIKKKFKDALKLLYKRYHDLSKHDEKKLNTAFVALHCEIGNCYTMEAAQRNYDSQTNAWAAVSGREGTNLNRGERKCRWYWTYDELIDEMLLYLHEKIKNDLKWLQVLYAMPGQFKWTYQQIPNTDRARIPEVVFNKLDTIGDLKISELKNDVRSEALRKLTNYLFEINLIKTKGEDTRSERWEENTLDLSKSAGYTPVSKRTGTLTAKPEPMKKPTVAAPRSKPSFMAKFLLD